MSLKLDTASLGKPDGETEACVLLVRMWAYKTLMDLMENSLVNWQKKIEHRIINITQQFNFLVCPKTKSKNSRAYTPVCFNIIHNSQ